MVRPATQPKSLLESTKVVVFIDDLDRCLPHNALKLLESLKLLFNYTGLVFVVALDMDPIEDYLGEYFEREYGSQHRERAYTYLDKIIQMPFWIPPHLSRFDNFIKQQLEKNLGSEDRRALSIDVINLLGAACNHTPRQLLKLLRYYFLDNFWDQGEENLLTPLSIARRLRNTAKNIYDKLLDYNDFCEELSKHRTHIELKKEFRENNQLSKLIVELGDVKNENVYSFDEICLLLASRPGREWLRDHKLRQALEAILQESDDMIQYYSELFQVAVTSKISSDDTKIIIAGLDELSIIHGYIIKSHPLKHKFDKLIMRLTTHNESIVKKRSADLSIYVEANNQCD